MKCPHCASQLGKLNAAGEPMLRTRGIVLQADQPVAICPKCKGAVPFEGAMAKAFSDRLVLFFKGGTHAPKR